ncbi:MAG TPA: hypothetical protein VHO25_13750 [Polyangiaceae bacterium]|nr:hypothetical protein [Polyangiaceae bacterium]
MGSLSFRGLPIVLAVVIAASACAPPAGFRPASGLLEDRSYEVGLGVARVSPRPYVIEEAQNTGQLWFSTEWAPWLLVSGLAAFDDNGALGGGALRWQVLKHQRVATGLELEGGVLWLGTSIPLALRLIDQTWLYTAPRLSNWGAEITPFVPVGVSARVIDGLSVRVEGQLSWADWKYYNRRVHLGLACAYQW